MPSSHLASRASILSGRPLHAADTTLGTMSPWLALRARPRLPNPSQVSLSLLKAGLHGNQQSCQQAFLGKASTLLRRAHQNGQSFLPSGSATCRSKTWDSLQSHSAATGRASLSTKLITWVAVISWRGCSDLAGLLGHRC